MDVIAAAVPATCRQVKLIPTTSPEIILGLDLKGCRALGLGLRPESAARRQGDIALDESRRIEKERISVHGLPVLRRRDERVVIIAFLERFLRRGDGVELRG